MSVRTSSDVDSLSVATNVFLDFGAESVLAGGVEEDKVSDRSTTIQRVNSRGGKSGRNASSHKKSRRKSAGKGDASESQTG